MAGMFLRNYYNSIMYSIFREPNSSADLLERECNYQVYDVKGNVNMSCCNGSYLALNDCVAGFPTGSGSSFAGLALGGNDTPVTFDDILFTPLSGYSGSVVTNWTPGYDKETNQWFSKIKYTINNTSGNDITAKEIALIYRSSTSYQGVMFYREVFDEPITIPAGESASLYFEYRFGL